MSEAARGLHGLSVLAVEPVPVLRRSLGRLLASFGVTHVRLFDSVQPARGVLGERAWDVILVDWSHPGPEITDFVAAAHREVPRAAIFATTDGERIDITGAVLAGCDAALPKATLDLTLPVTLVAIRMARRKGGARDSR